MRMVRGWVELVWVWARPCGGLVAGLLIVEHVGMRIVLLFCTHGINLGRTKLYRKKKGEGLGGSACRVARNGSERETGSSSFENSLNLPSRCSPDHFGWPEVGAAHEALPH